MEEELNLQNIAPSKLLNYVVKDALIAFLTPVKYSEVEHRLRTTLNKSTINLKEIKQYLSTRDDFISALRKSAFGQDAFAKYNAAVARLQNIDRAQGQAVRKVMTAPRRRFEGCLATRLKPTDYEHCLDNFDNEEFDNIKMVPSSLKQRVYEQGDQATKGILQQTVTKKTNTFSDLPSGLRSYISNHPDEFKDYYEQRRHEVGLMKAVLKNLSKADKQNLQAYYREHGKIEPDTVNAIISSSSSSESPQKRPRAQQPISKTGGSRFDLLKRIADSEENDLVSSFADQSLDDVLDFH